jgi:hypothetical protein
MELNIQSDPAKEFYLLALQAYKDGDLDDSEKLFLKEAADRLGLPKETKVKLLHAARDESKGSWPNAEFKAQQRAGQLAGMVIGSFNAMAEVAANNDLPINNSIPHSFNPQENWEALSMMRLRPSQLNLPYAERLASMCPDWGLDPASVLQGADDETAKELFEGLQVFRAFRSSLNVPEQLDGLNLEVPLPPIPGHGYERLAKLMPHILRGTSNKFIIDCARIIEALPAEYVNEFAENDVEIEFYRIHRNEARPSAVRNWALTTLQRLADSIEDD